MPSHLKQLVRARMEKTGESYATALRHIRAQSISSARPPSPPSPPSGPQHSGGQTDQPPGYTRDELAALVRRALREAGFGPRQVTVRVALNSESDLSVTAVIRDSAVSTAVVEKIVAQFEYLRHDGSGDILRGLNTWVHVDRPSQGRFITTATVIRDHDANVLSVFPCPHCWREKPEPGTDHAQWADRCETKPRGSFEADPGRYGGAKVSRSLGT
jgi:hypothetical protein